MTTNPPNESNIFYGGCGCERKILKWRNLEIAELTTPRVNFCKLRIVLDMTAEKQ